MNHLHFEKLERMYLSANINTMIFDSTQIKIEDKCSEIRLDLNEKYFHALGAMHGSVYFKMLDDAAFFAVNSIVEDVFVLTVEFNIQLKRPVSEGQIYAVGTLNSASDNSYLASSVLYNFKGKEVANGSGKFVKSKINLDPSIGYK